MCVILCFCFTFPLSIASLKLNHNEAAVLPSMDADDQPMVDNKVSIRVTYNHTGIVILTDSSNNTLGQGQFDVFEPSNQTSLSLSHGDTGIPADGMTIYMLIQIPSDCVNKDVTATLYADHNNDGIVNGEDSVVVNATGYEVTRTFQVTDALQSTIKVSNQQITKDNPVITVNEVILPGPGWVNIRTDNGGILGPTLTPMVSLEHGVNVNIMLPLTDVDLTYLNLINTGDNASAFIHLNSDLYNYDEFNATEDVALHSPSFNNPIFGNESAVKFNVELVKASSSKLPIMQPTIMISALLSAILTIKQKRKLNLRKI